LKEEEGQVEGETEAEETGGEGSLQYQRNTHTATPPDHTTEVVDRRKEETEEVDKKLLMEEDGSLC
jgi:hypothetical protein